MFVADGQSGAGRLAAERGRQADAAVYLAAVSAAVLGEQILTCKRTESTFSARDHFELQRACVTSEPWRVRKGSYFFYLNEIIKTYQTCFMPKATEMQLPSPGVNNL